MAPYLIGLVLMDMLLFGVETEKFDTMHFGEAHHGDRLCHGGGSGRGIGVERLP